MSEYTPLSEIKSRYETVKQGFFNHTTRNLEFRRQQLRNLFYAVLDHEEALKEALYLDLHRPSSETEILEINGILAEIDVAVRNLEDWARDKPIPADSRFALSRSVLKKEPYGTVLVIGPWNYPYLCTLGPIISAIAAGNTVVVKPTEVAINSSRVIVNVIEQAFNHDVVQVVVGGVEETTELLKFKFDKIMLTGSPRVGQIVAAAAAKLPQATPLALELGGKSPAIITSSANVENAAKRLAWAKFCNAGQTCIAPDYAIVDSKVAVEFAAAFQRSVSTMFPDLKSGAAESKDFAHIVNDRMWERLNTLVTSSKGSKWQLGTPNSDTKFFPPTIVRGVGFDDSLMQEEIFGPVLPIVEVDNAAIVAPELVRVYHDYPLALYVFSTCKQETNSVIAETRSGAVMVNDALVQGGSTGIPFGGVGGSGYGRYHGKWGFDEFTHEKPVITQPTCVEALLKARYAPYNPKNDKMIRLVSRPSSWMPRTGKVGSSAWLRLLWKVLPSKTLLLTAVVVYFLSRKGH